MIHPHLWIGDTSLIFLSLLIQGIPFLLLGALVGGCVTVFVPLSALIQSWPKHRVLSAFCGATFAFLIPACDCAVTPVVRRLVQKGIPLSAGFAYLLAAPTLNPICLASTYLAYRLGSPWHLLLLRAGGSLFLAMTIGILVSLLSPALILRGEVLLNTESETPSWMQIDPRLGSFRRKVGLALGLGLTDFLNVATLYVLGALCSALLQIVIPFGASLSSHRALDVPAAMLMAFLFSLCSSADAFVVNSFAALGLCGQLAFLWFGPVYNLRTLFVYRNVFQYRAIAFLGLTVVLLILGMTSLMKVLGWS